MATQSERNDDADRWADNTSWDSLMEGVDNRVRDPSDGLAEYLGTSVPSGFDDAWEDGFDSDAESRYNEGTSDGDRWLDAFEDTDNWNV